MKKNKGCISCVIGCAVLVVAAIVLLVSLSIWMTRKGEFNQTQTILNTESDFYFQVKLSEDEKAIAQFLQQINTQANQNNPLFKRFPMLRNLSKKNTERDLKKLLPLRVEVQGVPSAEKFQVSVGFSVYNRIASLIYYFLKSDAEKNGRLYHIDEKPYIEFIGKKQEPVLISLVDNTFYVSNEKEGMEQMLLHQNAGQKAHSGCDYFAELNLSSPAYGYMARSALSPRSLGFLGLSEEFDLDWFSPETISMFSWELDVGSDRGSLEGKVVLRLADLENADMIREKLELLRNELQGTHDMKGRGHMTITLSMESTDSGFVLHYEISDIVPPNQQTIHVNRHKEDREIEE